MKAMKQLVRPGLSCLLTLVPAMMACGSQAAEQQTAPQTFIAGASGDYLGQAPPGTALRRFASGIVPEDMYHSVTASPDGQEIYWADRHRGIMVTRRVDDRWTTPALVSFSGGLVSGGQAEDDAPVVSPDNTRLFFNSVRRYASNPEGGWRFWYVERTASGWSAPQPMPEVVNSTGGIHWQASVASSGTFYFGVFSASGGVAHFSIYFSRLVNGAYSAPEPLSAINDFASEVICPFVAPDESYIIFNRVVAGVSEGYYVSFKDGNGQWLAPQRLSQLPAGEESSFVTRDGRYVFSKAYWASAQIIEDLRPGRRR